MGLLFPGACPRVIADLPFACVRLCTGDVEVSERGGWGGGGDLDLLFRLLAHSVTDSCVCPGRGSNLHPWPWWEQRSNPLSFLARASHWEVWGSCDFIRLQEPDPQWLPLLSTSCVLSPDVLGGNKISMEHLLCATYCLNYLD